MVVDVYLNPQKPTRKVFKSWQHEIRVEYDATFYHPKPALRHNGSNVVKITTPTDLLYKVNAPVEIVSYTYKVKKHQMTDREKELIERVMQGDMEALKELCPNMDEKTIGMIDDAFKFAHKHDVPVDAMLLGLALSNVMPLANLNINNKD